MRSRWVMGVGTLLALAAAVLLLVLPMYEVASSSTVDGVTTSTSRAATMLDVEGASVLLPMLVPVAIAFVAWASPWVWLRWTLVALVGLFCLLGVLSVGLFYVPAAVALIVGAATARPREAAAGAAPRMPG